MMDARKNTHSNHRKWGIPSVPHRAFTLIELLIVVAIIAILSAIAVPNFLEAQTRAKVSRAKGDLRTIAVALELYKVDTNHYPPENAPYQPYRTPNNLTTPLGYLTSIPLDQFREFRSEDPDIPVCVWRRYVYQNFRQRSPYGCGCDDPDTPQRIYGPWVLNCIGPDRKYSGWLLYDPTNGTVSPGDIVRSAKRPDTQKLFPE